VTDKDKDKDKLRYRTKRHRKAMEEAQKPKVQPVVWVPLLKFKKKKK